MWWRAGSAKYINKGAFTGFCGVHATITPRDKNKKKSYTLRLSSFSDCALFVLF